MSQRSAQKLEASASPAQRTLAELPKRRADEARRTEPARLRSILRRHGGRPSVPGQPQPAKPIGAPQASHRLRLPVPRPPRVSTPAAHAFAVVITLLVFAVQHALVPLITLVPFILLFLAVFLAAWVGGRGPGFLAIALSAVLADFHFLPPENAWTGSPRALVLLGLFVLVSTVVDLLCGALRDAVTEAEQGARMLRYQLDVNTGIAQNAAEAIFVTDAAGRVTFANREAERIFGFSLAELQGKVLHDQVHHRHPTGQPLPASECPLVAINRGMGTIRDHEDVFVRKDGSLVHVACSSSPIEVEEQCLGAVLIARDIGERKQVEQALRQSERDLNRAQAVARTGSWRLAIDNDALLWSDETYRIFGIPKGTRLTYDIFLERIHPEDRAFVDARWQAALRGEPYDIEHRIVVDGAVKWVCERAELELDEQMNLIGGFGTVQDVTERKESEEKLRAANARLEEADRRKNEFLAMLSHELRNPLAPIGNSLFILGHAAPDSDVARHARAVIERQVAHLTRLVGDLLDVTRISRGKIELKCMRLDLADLAQRTVEDHASVFASRSLKVGLQLPPDPVWVHGDPTRLAQVLGNLLHNAAKFTPAGGRVTVSLERDGESAVVSVRDTGIGISPDLAPRVFQPFTQADRSLDRSSGGLGLGLALVKGIVELHGGEVRVSSEGLGRGAEFTLRLPAEARPPEQPPRDPAAWVEPTRRRLLVIEDNVDAAVTLKEALELIGHEVAVAFTGPEGLARARELVPEIVLCDIGLPGMDGYQVARSFRSDEKLRHVGLVALTGYALAEDQEQAAQAGFDRHLAKPVDLRALERVIAEIPERRRAG